MKPRPTPQSPDLSPRIAVLVIVIATLLAFGRLFTSDWTTWDDESFIARNPAFINASLSTLGRFWVETFYTLYIPLTATIWMVVSMLARSDVPDARGLLLNPYLFHAINVLVHAAAGIAVFALLRKQFARTWPALAGALVFVLHPVQVESVGWISGLKDLLAGALSIGTLATYLAATAAADPKPRRRFYLAAVAMFLLALLAKPSAMTTAGLLIAVDVLLLRRPLKKTAVWAVPFIVLAIAAAAIARSIQPVMPDSHSVPLWGRPLIVGHSLAFYLGKIIWPAHLGIDYGRHPDAAWQNGHVYLAWIVPAVLLAISLIAYRKTRWPLVAMAIFVIAPLHTLGLVGFDFQFISTTADHYLYTAMLAVALLIAWAVSAVPRNAGIALTVLLSIALGVRSFAQTGAWKDSAAMYDNALRVNPESWAIRNSLAAETMQRGEWPLAAALSQEVIARRPTYPVAYLTLGSARRQMGDFAGAEQAYRQSLALSRKVETLTNLGSLLAQMGRHAEGERMLLESLAYNPDQPKAYLNLGVLRYEQQRPDDAVQYLQKAIQLDPSDAEAQFNLAQLFLQLGRREEGLRHLRQAHRLQPNNPQIAETLRSAGVTPAGVP